MTLKLNSHQFTALHDVFEQITSAEKAKVQSMEGRLMLVILCRTFKQLYKKAIDKKKKYTIVLSEEEALAFWIFFKKKAILSGEAIYEANLIDGLCNQIHQRYSS